ncbi:Grx4 family monothiol glutaredoxin [Coxiella endosymbiont of Amblyomma sculptum]|uniref:Grx4 family monothiol glutaredoxin n=1 Tax=Coxiella endosymbiont of Amblyomma sculptum TaxID=2487929 RepID=UPI00132EEC14|nr:Grx4 family monothiol glutaredoxin [Coxiella endosymbiont of Amblyomma sculptum]QHG92616.1 Grx4 family monothiol glutaredoxin [Coxiella endosymbiont of Amblyomma sculptum]
MNIQEVIRQQIESSSVVLYMKGTPDFPQCGFSEYVVSVLHQCGVNFKSFNVLESDALRQGIKKFSNWPTIPQLYVKKKFIGGKDIVGELFENGKLLELLKDL